MLETRWLYSYLALCQEQNFTRAAQVLHISQPALTRQIQLLEDELHTTLINRSKKSLSFTQDGLLFRQKAREIIQLMEKAESSFSGEDDLLLEGDFYFGCAESAAMEYLSPVFLRLHQQYPRLRLHLHSGNALDLYDKLDNGLLDCALMINPSFHDPYDYIQLPWFDRFGLLYNPKTTPIESSSLTLDQLQGMPVLVSRQEEKNFPVALQTILQEGTIGTYNLIFNAASLVQAGLGSALSLKGLMAAEKFEDLEFAELKDYPPAACYVVFRKYQPRSFGMQAFLDDLDDRLKETGHFSEELPVNF